MRFARFACVPKSRPGYEVIANNPKARGIDVLRDDGILPGGHGELLLVYLCFDLVHYPFRRKEYEWSGERALRRLLGIYRGFLALCDHHMALLIESFDEAALDAGQKQEVERLTLTTVKDCLEGRTTVRL
jgi:hypothetical protein